MNLHQEMVTIWDEYYQKVKGVKYIYDKGKDWGNLKSIKKKIIQVLGEGASEEEIRGSWEALLMSIDDKFTLNNLTIPLVNSRFNILYSNGKARISTNHESYQKLINKDSLGDL